LILSSGPDGQRLKVPPGGFFNIEEGQYRYRDQNGLINGSPKPFGIPCEENADPRANNGLQEINRIAGRTKQHERPEG
jgi:hypothetical protein